MPRYLYCEPCGGITCGGVGVPLSRGAGEAAERAVWGTMRAPKMKVGSYKSRGVTDRQVVGRVGKQNVVEETVTIDETTTMEDAPHADLECQGCGALLTPGDAACAYSLGTEPAWEGRYLEIAHGS